MKEVDTGDSLKLVFAFALLRMKIKCTNGSSKSSSNERVT